MIQVLQTTLAVAVAATLLAVGPVASAQPGATSLADSVARSAPRGFVVRGTAGLAALSLGDVAAFHRGVADAYATAGVPVPTQRSFAPGPQVGIDVLWADGSSRYYGAGLRYVGSSAYSLYGDYAGTLDVVSTVSAVFVESVSVFEFRPVGRVQPFLGSRGGTVSATSSTREGIDLGDAGSGQSTFGGRGTGYSVEGFGGLTASAGPVGLFVQGGYRFARVARLRGSFVVDGQVVEEGLVPYSLNLSGWTGLVGLTVRRP